MVQSLNIRSIGIEGALLFRPHRHADERGWTGEVVSESLLRSIGVRFASVQENQSLSVRTGVIRGFHFQRAPHAQAKLVRIASGAVFSAVLDLRRGSPTYERAVGVYHASAEGDCLYVPSGCAHGLAALADNTVTCWSCDAPYQREVAEGVHWMDPALGLDWPVQPDDAIVSARDASFPRLAELPYRFDPTS